MKVLGYARVSLEEMADGQSLSAQREKIFLYCKLHGLELVEILIETASGGLPAADRPVLAGALAALDAGRADGLVVAKLDRLSRNVADFLRLMTEKFQKHQLVSVAELLDTRTAAGRMVAAIIATVAQFERERLSERTRDAMAHLRGQGRSTGKTPYGFRRVQRGTRTRNGEVEPVFYLEEDPQQQEGLKRAIALHHDGLSYRQIAAALDAEGYRPQYGERWAPASLSRLLRRTP